MVPGIVAVRCPRPWCGGSLIYDEHIGLRCLLCGRAPSTGTPTPATSHQRTDTDGRVSLNVRLPVDAAAALHALAAAQRTTMGQIVLDWFLTWSRHPKVPVAVALDGPARTVELQWPRAALLDVERYADEYSMTTSGLVRSLIVQRIREEERCNGDGPTSPTD